MGYLYGFLIFYAGMFVGFLMKWWLTSRTRYTGTIFVSKDDKKTVYSLELEEYPDEIRFKKEVVFKVNSTGWVHVDIPEESPNRE